ncbi:DUF2541 family protein [Portibacter marinus]|uniref:DUF2541 family protein n=1 Tax=Portibacter marinus TaxID=2898660 RepID=UPI001F37E984|nr:DUF2541 family protein [Portibacter marinus]
MKTLNVIFAFFLASSLMSFSPQNIRWDFLGQRTVNYKLDRDEIVVTAKEGSFRKIKLQVKKAPVEFRKVIVHYRNGNKETIEIRNHIPAGGETRTIDLNGKNRIISKVVFYYNSELKVRRKGVVKLYGLH